MHRRAAILTALAACRGPSPAAPASRPTAIAVASDAAVVAPFVVDSARPGPPTTRVPCIPADAGALVSGAGELVICGQTSCMEISRGMDAKLAARPPVVPPWRRPKAGARGDHGQRAV